MAHQITISDEVFARLKTLAEPFVDREPEDVIRRLIDEREPRFGDERGQMKSDRPQGLSPILRAPRQRGTTVEIDGHKIDAATVSELYQEALKLFVGKHISRLNSAVPMKTSGERFLIAREDKHPNGRRFFVPVEYHGFYMEAHKDYKNGIKHLRALCEHLGLALKYLR
jgi:hypothetical protein